MRCDFIAQNDSQHLRWMKHSGAMSGMDGIGSPGGGEVYSTLGRGGCYKSRENPGIAKIGLTPLPPCPPIMALWWISRQKARKCDSRQSA